MPLTSIPLQTLQSLIEKLMQKDRELDESKKQSVASKKVLAEQTRAFMKLAPEEASAAFNDLLRSYQMEVESLSKRCRLGEAAFSDLRTGISQLPQTSVVPPSGDSEETAALRTEIKDLEAELMTMKNQDVQVRRLEARVRELESQKRAESSAQEAEFARRQEDMELQFANRARQLKTELEALTARAKAAENEVSEAHRERVSEKQRADQLLSSQREEIAHLSRQVEELQVKLSVSGGQSSTLATYKDLAAQSAEKLAAVEEELRAARAKSAHDKLSFDNERKSLHTQIQAASHSVTQVEARYQLLAETISRYTGDVTDPQIAIEALISGLQAQVDQASSQAAEWKIERNRLIQEIKEKSEQIAKTSTPRRLSTTEGPLVTTEASTDEVVGIIQGQRDRFRNRVLELEGERDELKQSEFELSNRINAIISDLRKMENERNFWKTQSTEIGKARSPGDVEMGPVSGTNTPPTLASVRRKLNGSNELEQSLTSLIIWGLGNQVTRRAAFAYLLTLHMLVFFVLYRLSSIVSSSSK